MENYSRRSLLRMGGIMSGGLILPWAGSKALALAEPAAAADLAVVETVFPVSTELRSLRSMIREHADWRLEATIAQHHKDERDLALFAARARAGLEQETCFRTGLPLHDEVGRRVDAYEAHAAQILERPVRSWGDVAEIAEIAWSVAPKVGDRWDGGPEAPVGTVPALLRKNATRHPRYQSDISLAANAALIEGVLTMAGGERYDPLYDFDRRWSEYQIKRSA